jgi:hypothetical protein
LILSVLEQTQVHSKQTQQWSLSIFIALAVALLSCVSLAAEVRTKKEPVTVNFHVSPNGNDAWAGTKHKPFATLERARDATRESRKKGLLSKGEVTVWLRDGVYERTQKTSMSATTSSTATRASWTAPRGISDCKTTRPR